MASVAIIVDASLATEASYYTTLAQLPATAMAIIDGAALLFVGPQFRPRARPNARGVRAGDVARRA